MRTWLTAALKKTLTGIAHLDIAKPLGFEDIRTAALCGLFRARFSVMPKLPAAHFAGPKALCFRFLWGGQRHSARLAIEILATTVVVNAGLYVSPVGRPFRLGGHARSCRQQGESQNKGHGYYAWHAAPPEVRFSGTMGRLRAMLTPANYTGLPVAPVRRIPWNCQAARFRPDNRNTSSKKCAKFRSGVQCL